MSDQPISMQLSWDDGVGSSGAWGRVNWLVDVKVELKYWLKLQRVWLDHE